MDLKDSVFHESQEVLFNEKIFPLSMNKVDVLQIYPLNMLGHEDSTNHVAPRQKLQHYRRIICEK